MTEEVRAVADVGAGIDDGAVTELAAALVRLRTVNEAGAIAVEEPAVELIAGVMRGFGWDVTVTPIAAGRMSVVAVITGDGPGRTLMFEGHVDVVTEGDPAAWSFDPYAGDVVDGRLRGRGSADMKAGVAAMVHAARAVQLAGFDGSLVVAVLADEEGMMLGAKRFAQDLRSGSVPGVDRIDGVIVCEPEGGQVCPVAKGALRIVVTFTGVMCHAAMPRTGRNPLPALGALLARVAEIERRCQAEIGPHDLLGEVSLTPTVVNGGDLQQINVIPSSAVVAFDIRTVPGVDHHTLVSTLTRAVKRVAAEFGVAGDLAVIDDRPPVDTPVDAAVVRSMLAGHLAVTGLPAVIGGVPGATDGTILTRDAGLPTVVYGPGGKWIAHQVDEFAEVQDILTCTRSYVAAAQHFLAGA